MRLQETQAYCEKCGKMVDWEQAKELAIPVWVRQCSNLGCAYVGKTDIFGGSLDDLVVLGTFWLKQPTEMVEFMRPEVMQR